MAKIFLSGKKGEGLYCLIDDEDFSIVSKYRWYLSNGGYAITNYWKGINKHFHLTMHRFILGAKNGQIYDHINQDKLDNRKSNLRTCTPSQNRMNTKIRSDNSSGYKGIYWNSESKKWKAQIQLNGRRKCVGRFNNPEEAAQAYNFYAKKYYGEFAYLN